MLLTPVQSTPQTAHAELLLDGRVGEVFAYVTDLSNMPTWWPEHTVYRRLFGDGGPGTSYALVYQTRLLPIAGVSLVQIADAERRFVYYVASLGIRVRFEYDFRAEGERTAVRFQMRSFLLPPPIPPAEMTRAFERLGAALSARAAPA